MVILVRVIVTINNVQIPGPPAGTSKKYSINIIVQYRSMYVSRLHSVVPSNLSSGTVLYSRLGLAEGSSECVLAPRFAEAAVYSSITRFHIFKFNTYILSSTGQPKGSRSPLSAGYNRTYSKPSTAYL